MPVGLDSFGRLASDRTCIGCGHNLRGLLPDGACCECGLAVDISLSGSRLAGADARWLERLTAGTGLLTSLLPWMWVPLAWPVVVVAGWWAAAPNPAGLRWERWTAGVLRGVLVISVAAPTLAACVVVGLWRYGDLLVPLVAVTGLLLTWTVLFAFRVSGLIGLKPLRRAGATVCVGWLTGAVLVLSAVTLSVQKLPRSVADLILPLSVLGITGLVSGAILLPILLIRLWRALDLATTLACARRDRRHAHVPISHLAAAATAPAGSAAAPPAPA